MASCDDTSLVNEPDNIAYVPYALRCKRNDPYPLLAPSDDSPAYERLWATALGAEEVFKLPTVVGTFLDRSAEWLMLRSTIANRSSAYLLKAAVALGRPRVPQRSSNVVAKTVHAQLSIEWITHRFNTKVVVVRRDPLVTLASWKTNLFDTHASIMNWSGPKENGHEWAVAAPPPDASMMTWGAYRYGVLFSALHYAITRNRDWIVMDHDALCREPSAGFSECADRLSLTFGDKAREFLSASDRPGSGFDTKRLAREMSAQRPSALSIEEIAECRSMLHRFPALRESTLRP